MTEDELKSFNTFKLKREDNDKAQQQLLLFIEAFKDKNKASWGDFINLLTSIPPHIPLEYIVKNLTTTDNLDEINSIKDASDSFISFLSEQNIISSDKDYKNLDDADAKTRDQLISCFEYLTPNENKKIFDKLHELKISEEFYPTLIMLLKAYKTHDALFPNEEQDVITYIDIAAKINNLSDPLDKLTNAFLIESFEDFDSLIQKMSHFVSLTDIEKIKPKTLKALWHAIDRDYISSRIDVLVTIIIRTQKNTLVADDYIVKILSKPYGAEWGHTIEVLEKTATLQNTLNFNFKLDFIKQFLDNIDTSISSSDFQNYTLNHEKYIIELLKLDNTCPTETIIALNEQFKPINIQNTEIAFLNDTAEISNSLQSDTLKNVDKKLGSYKEYLVPYSVNLLATYIPVINNALRLKNNERNDLYFDKINSKNREDRQTLMTLLVNNILDLGEDFYKQCIDSFCQLGEQLITLNLTNNPATAWSDLGKYFQDIALYTRELTVICNDKSDFKPDSKQDQTDLNKFFAQKQKNYANTSWVNPTRRKQAEDLFTDVNKTNYEDTHTYYQAILKNIQSAQETILKSDKIKNSVTSRNKYGYSRLLLITFEMEAEVMKRYLTSTNIKPEEKKWLDSYMQKRVTKFLVTLKDRLDEIKDGDKFLDLKALLEKVTATNFKDNLSDELIKLNNENMHLNKLPKTFKYLITGIHCFVDLSTVLSEEANTSKLNIK
jgi:hypothetical protein